MTLAELQAEITRKVQDSSYTPAIQAGLMNDGLDQLAGQFFLPALKAQASVTLLGTSYVPLPDDYHKNLVHVWNDSDNRRLRVYRSVEQMIADYPRDLGESGALTACAVEDLAAPQAAKGTLTLAELPVVDETFTVASQVFTFKALRSTTGEVTIGATVTATAANIVTAIGLDLTSVTATSSAGVVTLTAAATGYAGNLLVLTESATNLTVDGLGTLGATQVGGKYAVLRVLRSPSSAKTLRLHYHKRPAILTGGTDTPAYLPTHLHRDLLVNFACKEIFTEIYGDEPEGAGQKVIALYEGRYARGVAELLRHLGPVAREPQKATDKLHWDGL